MSVGRKPRKHVHTLECVININYSFIFVGKNFLELIVTGRNSDSRVLYCVMFLFFGKYKRLRLPNAKFADVLIYESHFLKEAAYLNECMTLKINS